MITERLPLNIPNKGNFRVQANVARGFREVAESLDCLEVFTPTIAASATEGGAEYLKLIIMVMMLFSPVPQHKQIMVGVYERVYLFSHAYRSEPSVTTRHLSEVVQMDANFPLLKVLTLDYLEEVGTGMIKKAAEYSHKEMEM